MSLSFRVGNDWPIRFRPIILACILGFSIPSLISQEDDSSEKAPDKAGLSLQGERTIRFSTREGTYMNLDVSPDGRTIVFDLLGDIYTIPIEGGEANRLTSGMAYDVQPTFSPDGSHLAFISDRSGSDNLWVMEADGSDPKAISKEKEQRVSTPDWAPDGTYLLARRQGDLWLYHKAGGSGLKLTSSDLAQGLTGPSFSPDGRYIYFSSRSGGGGQGIARFTSWQVRRLDRVTGDIATITASPNGAFRPTLSPDGRRLAYGIRLDAKTGLRIRNLENDREDWITYGIDRDNAERPGMLDLMPAFDFTPDGNSLILATGGTFHRFGLDNGRDETISFSADVEQELGPLVYHQGRVEDGPVKQKNLRYAGRDSSRGRLVFSALGRIWIQSLPTGTPVPLVEQAAGQHHPVFSPDGSELVYVTWSDLEGGHVWKVAVEGTRAGQPVRLTTHAGYYLHPTWAPDGSKVAFIKEDAAAFRNIWSRNTGRIVWLDSNGGQPLNEVTSAPSDNRLSFSSDGTRLNYVANVRGGRSANSELLSVRLDGTDKRTLAKLQAESYEAVPSPDGRWLAFAVREDVYLAALPLSAEPPTIGESKGPGPVKRITREGGIDLHWEDEGRTLSWGFADEFFWVDVEEALASSETQSTSADNPSPSDSPEAEEDAKKEEFKPHSVAIDITVPRYRPSGRVALVGATVIPMNSPEVIANATVLVQDNRITAVGPSDSVPIPPDAQRFDVSGKFIMPGMIDLHAHLRPPREVFVGTSWSYLANLAYGVTTTRDVSTSSDSFAYRELVESGRLLGPRIYSTGRAMTTTNAKIESLEDARAIIRHYKKMGTNVTKQYMQPHRRQGQWVIQAAQEEEMNVTNEGGGDLRLNMTQILDGYTGVEHSLPVANLYDDVIQLVARSGTWYTPTLVVSYGGPTAEWYFYQTTEVHDDPKLSRFTPRDDLDRRTRRGQYNAPDEYHFLAVSQGAAKILKQGGKVALGAHGEQQGICAHWELWALQMGGLSNFEALQTATTIAAAGLGFQEDLGTLENGKLADLLVLNANPLVNIRNSNTILYVMKNGELFEGDTLNQLWPQAQPRAPLGYRVIAPPEKR